MVCILFYEGDFTKPIDQTKYSEWIKLCNGLELRPYSTWLANGTYSLWCCARRSSAPKVNVKGIHFILNENNTESIFRSGGFSIPRSAGRSSYVKIIDSALLKKRPKVARQPKKISIKKKIASKKKTAVKKKVSAKSTAAKKRLVTRRKNAGTKMGIIVVEKSKKSKRKLKFKKKK